MKRSEVNREIEWAKALLASENIKLPPFAYWTLREWAEHTDADMVKKAILGWDVTDYSLGTYNAVGGVLFTVRNGDQKDRTIGVPYAEKYILLRDGQGLPTHFHYTKTEDIINRAGGVLGLKLHNARKDLSVDTESDVVVYTDGVRRVVKAGEPVYIQKGESITLTPYMYHSFWAEKGEGDLVVGEVSSVNDDNTDNHFNPEMPRYVALEEDEAPVHPLCNEYDTVL